VLFDLGHTFPFPFLFPFLSPLFATGLKLLPEPLIILPEPVIVLAEMITILPQQRNFKRVSLLRFPAAFLCCLLLRPAAFTIDRH
jgi:hypothetical protein